MGKNKQKGLRTEKVDEIYSRWSTDQVKTSGEIWIQAQGSSIFLNSTKITTDFGDKMQLQRNNNQNLLVSQKEE